MYQLVSIDGCVHVFDVDGQLFVKSTQRNVAQALGLAGKSTLQGELLTRRRMIAGANWAACQGRGCKVCTQEGLRSVKRTHATRRRVEKGSSKKISVHLVGYWGR